jgi:hypothetical protein
MSSSPLNWLGCSQRIRLGAHPASPPQTKATARQAPTNPTTHLQDVEQPSDLAPDARHVSTPAALKPQLCHAVSHVIPGSLRGRGVVGGGWWVGGG